MNLCTDQLAMLLADPGQLISVSHVSLDPLSSPLHEQAATMPVNRGGAEEIYLMQPDLVLAADWSDPLTLRLLRDLGVEVVQFPTITSIDAIPGQLRAIGQALGQDARANEVVEGFERRLAALPIPPSDPPVAAFFYASGYSLGPETLSDDILTRAGFANLATQLGKTGGGRLSTEELLIHQPDAIITSELYAGSSRAEEVMSHDALKDIPRVTSGAEWGCGTPFVLDAIEDLIKMRAALN